MPYKIRMDDIYDAYEELTRDYNRSKNEVRKLEIEKQKLEQILEGHQLLNNKGNSFDQIIDYFDTKYKNIISMQTEEIIKIDVENEYYIKKLKSKNMDKYYTIINNPAMKMLLEKCPNPLYQLKRDIKKTWNLSKTVRNLIEKNPFIKVDFEIVVSKLRSEKEQLNYTLQRISDALKNFTKNPSDRNVIIELNRTLILENTEQSTNETLNQQLILKHPYTYYNLEPLRSFMTEVLQKESKDYIEQLEFLNGLKERVVSAGKSSKSGMINQLLSDCCFQSQQIEILDKHSKNKSLIIDAFMSLLSTAQRRVETMADTISRNYEPTSEEITHDQRLVLRAMDFKLKYSLTTARSKYLLSLLQEGYHILMEQISEDEVGENVSQEKIITFIAECES